MDGCHLKAKKVHIRNKEIVTTGTGNGSYGIWKNIKSIDGDLLVFQNCRKVDFMHRIR